MFIGIEKMINVDEVKQWVRISSDDDALLQMLIKASLAYISNYCNRLFFETEQSFQAANLTGRDAENAVIIEKLGDVQRENIKNARLKLIADWYEYRTDITEYNTNSVPDGIRAILQPFWIYKLVRNSDAENK